MMTMVGIKVGDRVRRAFPLHAVAMTMMMTMARLTQAILKYLVHLTLTLI